MTEKYILWIAGGIAAFIIFCIAAFLGFLDPLFYFAVANPFLLISLVGIIIIALAFQSGEQKIALMGVSLFIFGIGFDMYAPPYSMTCLEDTQSGLAFIEQSPASALGEDTFICKLWIETTNFNPVIFKLDLGEPIPIGYYIIPLLLLISIIFVILAIKLDNPEFWIPATTFFVVTVMVAYLIDGLVFSSIAVTLAGLFAYVLVAPALILLSLWLAALSRQ
jgi:hypothetical protein